MNIILLSDIHATNKNPIGRKDNILKTFERKFTFVLEYAKKHNATILQSGDFFDKARDWHILFLMINLLKKYEVPIYTIFGQHDLFFRSDPRTIPTTMGTLNKLGLINILNENPTILNNNYIFGCSWGNPIPKPTPNQTNILVIHASITTKSLFPGHKFIPTPSFVSKNPGWDLILAGDIHIKAIYKSKKNIFVNTGPMLRLESARYNFKHQPCFVMWQSHKIREVTIPHEEARLILSRGRIVKKPVEKLLPATTLKQFAKLLHQKNPNQRPLKKILDDLTKKHSTSKQVKKYLLEIMENDDT